MKKQKNTHIQSNEHKFSDGGLAMISEAAFKLYGMDKIEEYYKKFKDNPPDDGANCMEYDSPDNVKDNNLFLVDVELSQTCVMDDSRARFFVSLRWEMMRIGWSEKYDEKKINFFYYCIDVPFSTTAPRFDTFHGAEFTSFDELDVVSDFKTLANFYRFEMTEDNMVMAVFDEGYEWYVIGATEYNIKELPVWKAKYRN